MSPAQRKALVRVADSARPASHGMLPRPGEALALRRLAVMGLIVERNEYSIRSIRGPEKYALTDSGRAALAQVSA